MQPSRKRDGGMERWTYETKRRDKETKRREIKRYVDAIVLFYKLKDVEMELSRRGFITTDHLKLTTVATVTF